jgi:hypothetical protein
VFARAVVECVVRCSVFLIDCRRHSVDSCVWEVNRVICMTRSVIVCLGVGFVFWSRSCCCFRVLILKGTQDFWSRLPRLDEVTGPGESRELSRVLVRLKSGSKPLIELGGRRHKEI